MSRIKASEQFTMLGYPQRDNVFGDYCEQYSAKTYNLDVGIYYLHPPPLSGYDVDGNTDVACRLAWLCRGRKCSG
jgi:hypothetical protein